MAGKAKFDQESAFKSIIGPGRSLCHRFLASLRKKAKVKIGYRDLIFWIGILIRLCVRWHWRRRRILLSP